VVAPGDDPCLLDGAGVVLRDGCGGRVGPFFEVSLCHLSLSFEVILFTPSLSLWHNLGFGWSDMDVVESEVERALQRG
jgi:hypothetical protein